MRARSKAAREYVDDGVGSILRLELHLGKLRRRYHANLAGYLYEARKPELLI